MNTDKIRNSLKQWIQREDAIAQAYEAERLAYIAGNEELANAYYLIAELLEYKLSVENDED
jgi:hypothetical protein